MTDMYMLGKGDIVLASNGDIGLTDSVWRQDVQDCYTRVMTEVGDYVLYPTLGADLYRLYGMPQSRETAEFGKQLIAAALNRENRFAGKYIDIQATPTGPQTIRFDIYISSGDRNRLLLSVQQDLGII